MFKFASDLLSQLSASAQDVLSGNSFSLINVSSKTADPDLEREILREAASYGRQLSALNDVVAYLIRHTSADEDDASVKKFSKVHHEIIRVKDRYHLDRKGTDVDLLQAMISLADKEPVRFERLMRELDGHLAEPGKKHALSEG